MPTANCQLPTLGMAAARGGGAHAGSGMGFVTAFVSQVLACLLGLMCLCAVCLQTAHAANAEDCSTLINIDNSNIYADYHAFTGVTAEYTNCWVTHMTSSVDRSCDDICTLVGGNCMYPEGDPITAHLGSNDLNPVVNTIGTHFTSSGTGQDSGVPRGVMWSGIARWYGVNNAPDAGTMCDDVFSSSFQVACPCGPLPPTIVAPASNPFTAEGSSSQFAVKLSKQPDSDVSLAVTSGDTGKLTINTASASLTFTTTSWDTTQNVAFTTTDNQVDADTATVDVTLTETGSTEGIATATVSVDVTDNDTAGINLSTTDLGSFAMSSSVSFVVKLDSEPASGEVVLDISGSDVSFDKNSMTFTTSDWSTGQTVVVTGNSVTSDTATTISVAVNSVATADTKYSAMNAESISATVLAAGLSVTETSLTIAEGAAGTFDVSLISAPAAGKVVVVTVSSDDTAAATVSPAELTFTPSDATTGQTVTVTAPQNFVDAAAATPTITVVVDDANTNSASYSSAMTKDITTTITDDDTAGVTVSKTSLDADEGSTGSYTIMLTSSPASGESVIVTLTSDAAAVATLAPASVTFTQSNWNSPVTITVTATANDVDAATDGTATLTGSVSGTAASYPGTISVADVAFTSTDDDVAGITLSKSTLTVAESAGTGTFTVVLDSSPVDGKQVVLNVGSSAGSVASVSPSTLTFLAADWNMAQTVTVTGASNFVDAGDGSATVTVSVNAGSTDETSYASTSSQTASVTSTNDDAAGVTISAAGGSLIIMKASGTATLTVTLDSEPTADVVLNMASSAAAAATVAPAVLTFTASNWNVEQTVTVTGQNVATTNVMTSFTITGTVNAGASAGEYGAVAAGSVAGTVYHSGITLSKTALSIAEDGATATFTAVINSAPGAGMVVVLDVTSGMTSAVTASPATLTCSDTTWKTAQTVTVTGVANDVDAADAVATITVAVNAGSTTESDYGTMSKTVAVTAVNNDADGIIVSKTDVSMAEDAATATFTVKLASAPAAGKEVVLSTRSSDGAVATVSPAKLTFTATNWSDEQTVTVTGTGNHVDAAHASATITVAVVATDTTEASYSTSTASKTVGVLSMNNDADGIVLSKTSVTVAEDGGTETFSVVLTSAPASGKVVVLSAMTGDAAVATASPASLTFSDSDWSTARTVTVTGTSNWVDAADAATVITVAVDTSATTEPSYTASTASKTVDVLSTSNDADGIVLSKTAVTVAEAAGTATFTVKLTSSPAAGKVVVLDVTSSDTAVATAANSRLTFLPGTWNSAQTVTVTGVANDVDAANAMATITVAVNTGSTTEASYTSATASKTVTATSVDDDTAGFTFATGTTPIVVAEPSGSATTTVVLHSEPNAGSVVVQLTSSDESAATISPSSVTFTAANWNVAQTATVTAQDNMLADATREFSVSAAIDASAAPIEYGSLAAQTLSGNAEDNESPAIVLSTAELAVSSNTVSRTYTIVLDTEPIAPVKVSLSIAASPTPAGLSISSNSLTFSTSNWNVAQTVTVTVAPHDVEEPYTTTVTHGVAATSGSYTTSVSADLAVSVSGVSSDVKPAAIVVFSAATLTLLIAFVGMLRA